MNLGLDTVLRGASLGLALFALAAHALLLVHSPVPAWLAAASCLGGLWLASRAPAPRSSERLAPGWTFAALAVVAAVAAAMVVGAVSTPSRFWDGLVAWDVRAAFLTAAPTLEQAYFRDQGIYAHSRDYPVLQPLLVALGNRTFGGNSGRLLFPVLYLLAVGTVAAALRRAAVRPAVAVACALGLAVTPMLVNPTSGGVDSGYADLLLSCGVTCIAAGIVTRMPLHAAAGIVITVFSKPEGLLYGLLPLVVAFVAGNARLFGASLLAWFAAACLLLPVQYELNHFGEPAPVGMWLGLAGAGIVLVAVHLAADRCRIRPRARLAAIAIAIPALILLLPFFGGLLESIGGTLRVYLGDPERPWQRLPRLWPVLLGIVDHAFVRQRFALAYWLVLFVVAGRLWHRQRGTSGPVLFLGLGLLSTLVPFLLSPEQDLDHHLRSTMSRLLLHWLGAAWLVVGSEWPGSPAPGEVARPGENPA